MKTTHSKNMKNLLIHGLCMMVVTGLHAAEPAKSSSKGSDQKPESVLKEQTVNKLPSSQPVREDSDTPPILAIIGPGKQVEMLTQDEMSEVHGEYIPQTKAEWKYFGKQVAVSTGRGMIVPGVVAVVTGGALLPAVGVGAAQGALTGIGGELLTPRSKLKIPNAPAPMCKPTKSTTRRSK